MVFTTAQNGMLLTTAPLPNDEGAADVHKRFCCYVMELECITLSKRSQAERDKYPVISLICGI